MSTFEEQCLNTWQAKGERIARGDGRHANAPPKRSTRVACLTTYDRDNMSISSIIGTTLSFISGIWLPATLLCCIPWVQKRKAQPIYQTSRDGPLTHQA
jgi:hypothetical protein